MAGSSNEYKLVITAKDLGKLEEKGDTSGTLKQTETEKVNHPVRAKINSVKKTVNATGAGMIASMVINYKIGRVGVETGNQQVQSEINAAKSVAGLGIGLAGSFIFGGIGGLALAGIGAGIGMLLKYDSFNYEKDVYNRVLDIQRERAGIDYLTINRSRRERK